jgi:hypothetical protein
VRFVRFDPPPALAGIGLVRVRDSGRVALGPGRVIPGDDAETLASLLAAPDPESRRRDRYGVLALIAAREALREAGLADAPRRGERCGVMIGTTHASSEGNGRYAGDLASATSTLSPSLFVRTTSGAAAADVACAFRMAGPGQTFASGWTAGAEALAAAARAVARGAADLMLAGAVEAPGPIFAHAGALLTEGAAIAVVAPDAPPDRPRLLAYGRGAGAGGLDAILARLAEDCGLGCAVVVEANESGSHGVRRAGERTALSVEARSGRLGAVGVVMGCLLATGMEGPALVVARDPAGDVAALLLG